MRRTLWWIGVLLGAAVSLLTPAVQADESDPLPAPRGTPHEQAISAYNEGVTLLRAKHYASAQEKFEQALALDEAQAEAHNNLAFSLRMQGTHIHRACVETLQSRSRAQTRPGTSLYVARCTVHPDG